MADNHSPDDSIAFKQIGYLATSWALLEGTIEQILWFLMNTTKGRAVTMYISTPTQIAIILKLTKEVVSEADIEEALKPILKRIEDIRQLRNRAIHCKWDDAEGDDNSLVLKALDYESRASLEPTEIRLSAQEVADANKEIGDAHTDLMNFYLPLGFTPSFELFYNQE